MIIKCFPASFFMIGNLCELEDNDCEMIDACQNGATCIDGRGNFTCSCAPGYE